MALRFIAAPDMSFSDLYERVQASTGKISTRWLRDQAISLSSITRVREQWSGVLDDARLRGFYIEGPLNPPVPLAENEALIVLARSLDKSTRRLVYTKELMHVFDAPEEKANSAERFDIQIERFADPTAETSPQFKAETKALFRAVSVLCRERDRVAYKSELEAGSISLEVVSATLQIPPNYARHLFRDDYPTFIDHIR